MLSSGATWSLRLFLTAEWNPVAPNMPIFEESARPVRFFRVCPRPVSHKVEFSWSEMVGEMRRCQTHSELHVFVTSRILGQISTAKSTCLIVRKIRITSKRPRFRKRFILPGVALYWVCGPPKTVG
jgi:hypothetical protein